MIHFTVKFPTDEGYIGRECNNAFCRRYFRIHSDDLDEQMYCPYCGNQFKKNDFFTASQIAYARNVAKEKAKKYAHDTLDKILQRTFGRSSGSGLIKWKVRPSNCRERPVNAHYREHKVDSSIACNDCHVRFQVDGIFGYCPRCRAEHIRIYDADVAIIRNEIEKGPNPDRSLRHAYGDLVSTFEMLCRRKARKFSSDNPSFQRLSQSEAIFSQSHQN